MSGLRVAKAHAYGNDFLLVPEADVRLRPDTTYVAALARDLCARNEGIGADGLILYTLRERGALRVEKEVGTRSAVQMTVTAILINILNPKLSIFFFAFLPQFVSANEPHPLSRMLELSAVFMLLTLVVFVGYGLFAASIRNHVVSRPRVLTWMRRTFAAAFVALGAKLALAER